MAVRLTEASKSNCLGPASDMSTITPLILRHAWEEHWRYRPPRLSSSFALAASARVAPPEKALHVLTEMARRKSPGPSAICALVGTAACEHRPIVICRTSEGSRSCWQHSNTWLVRTCNFGDLLPQRRDFTLLTIRFRHSRPDFLSVLLLVLDVRCPVFDSCFGTFHLDAWGKCDQNCEQQA